METNKVEPKQIDNATDENIDKLENQMKNVKPFRYIYKWARLMFSATSAQFTPTSTSAASVKRLDFIRITCWSK